MAAKRRNGRALRRLLYLRWWWLVGWAFPNMLHRHHLAEQADRARHADLAWYGLPLDVEVVRSFSGMSGSGSGRRGAAFHTASCALSHNRPRGPSLQVTVQRRGTYGDMAPLARSALPLVRNRDGMSDPRWRARSPEEFLKTQERALAALIPEALTVVVDGTSRVAESIRVGNDWAAFVALPTEVFDLELRGRGWPTDDLRIEVVNDLTPYFAGSQASVGPLLLPRRLRLRR